VRLFALEGAPLVPGTIYTLATYGSTDLAAADISHSPLPGLTTLLLVESTSLRLLAASEGPLAEYDLWTFLNGVPEGQRGFGDNPSGDGTSNGLKFYLGLAPNMAVPQGIVPTTVEDGGVVYPGISFDRREELGGVTGFVVVSADLHFTTDLGSQEVSAVSLGNGLERVLVRSLVPLSESQSQYFRIFAAEPEL
jgi:hypothetical protein